MILNLCPKCGAKCPPGKKRCSEHTRKDNRPSAHAQGYDAQHRRERLALIRRQPICCDPFNEGCQEPTTVLDHMDGLGPKGPAGHDASNHIGMCHSCHSRKTAQQSPGGWNAG